MNKKHNILPHLNYIFFGLLIICGLCLVQPNNTDIQFKNVQFAHGKTFLSGRIWIPEQADKPMPSVLFVHGVNSNKEYMDLAAQFLARHQIVAMVFDLGGYGESDYYPESAYAHLEATLSALKSLRQYPFVDSQKVSLMGHSMGATSAIETALNDPTIFSVAAFGMSEELPSVRPCRIYWGSGLYDTLHPPSEMRGAYKKSLSVKKNSVCNTHITLSPTSNHQTARHDPYLLKDYLTWLQEQYQQPTQDQSNIPFLKFFAFHLLLLGTVTLLFTLSSQSKSQHILKIISVGYIGFWLTMGSLKEIPPVLASQLCIYGFLMLFLGTFQTKEQVSQLLKLGGFMGLIFLAIEAAKITLTFPEYLTHPEYLLYIPIYLVQSLFQFWIALGLFLKPFVFENYNLSLKPNLVFLLPFIWVVFFSDSLPKITDWLQSSLRTIFEPSPKWIRPSLKSILLLIALGVTLGLLIWQRFQNGYLTSNALLKIWHQGLKYGLMSLLIFWIELKLLKTLKKEPSKKEGS